MIPEVTAEEIEAGRKAWPHIPDEQLPDEIRRAKISTDMRERAAQHLENLKRTARRERIAAGMPEFGDCDAQHDIVCPHCGNWMPGEILPVHQLTPNHIQRRHFEVECAHCKEHIGCKAEVRFSFTTFKLDVIEEQAS